MKRIILVLLLGFLILPTSSAQNVDEVEISFTFPDFHFALNQEPGLFVTSGFKGSFRRTDSDYGVLVGGSYGYTEAEDVELYVKQTQVYTGLVLLAYENHLIDYWFTVEPVVGYSEQIINSEKYGRGKGGSLLIGTLISARWKYFYVSGGLLFSPVKDFKNDRLIRNTNFNQENKYSVMIGFGFNL